MLKGCTTLLTTLLFFAAVTNAADFTLTRDKNWLIINDPDLPGGEIRINYLEAYCRPNSTRADWHDTTIGHTSEVLSMSADKRTLKLRDTLKDGVTVEHKIMAKDDAVRFELTAHNPTKTASQAHWAQPCIRLGSFTGFTKELPSPEDYLPRCFIFLDGKLTRLSEVKPWAKEARYTPGQVWPGPNVTEADVNPRPLSSLKPSNGLIGCFSSDEKLIFAVAFEPYQELFQGVARCLHSDFRIGGLQPSETKQIRGALYIVPNDVPALLKKYEQDFPEHAKSGK